MAMPLFTSWSYCLEYPLLLPCLDDSNTSFSFLAIITLLESLPESPCLEEVPVLSIVLSSVNASLLVCCVPKDVSDPEPGLHFNPCWCSQCLGKAGHSWNKLSGRTGGYFSSPKWKSFSWQSVHKGHHLPSQSLIHTDIWDLGVFFLPWFSPSFFPTHCLLEFPLLLPGILASTQRCENCP